MNKTFSAGLSVLLAFKIIVDVLLRTGGKFSVSFDES